MKRISILYDELGFVMRYGGVSRLFAEVMRGLPTDCMYKLSAVCSCNEYLQAEPFRLPPYSGGVDDFVRTTLRGRGFRGVSHVYKLLSRLMPKRFASGELLNERSRKRMLSAGDFDIYHTTVPHPMFNTWKSVVGRKPIVATVVDLIPELLANSKRVAYYRRNLLNNASHVIAITENTKRDVMRLYGVPEEKVSVVYLGYNMHAAKADEEIDIGARWNLSARGYVLFVGKRAGYKNFAWMVRALAPLLKAGLKLFCTGGAFSLEERRFLGELGLQNAVVQDFVSDVEMQALFESALAFVYPSRYEGFGIPILDAFAAGCPVILARSSCFPEVAGDAALYFDLEDSAGLRQHVLRLQNEQERQSLILRGKNRVKAFSWEKCAKETADVYRRLV